MDKYDDELVDAINTNNIKWIDLQFFTPDCRMRRCTVSATSNSVELRDGFTLSQDMLPTVIPPLYLVPDPETYAIIPWANNTLRVLCKIENGEDRGRCLKDPRYIIERLVMNYKSLGLKAQVSPAISFYIFDTFSISKASDVLSLSAIADSRENANTPNTMWESREGHYITSPEDQFYPFRAQLSDILEGQFRYGVEEHRHGDDAYGKQYLRLKFLDVKNSADGIESLKFVAKSIAAMNGNLATFMPLPFSQLTPGKQSIMIRIEKNMLPIFSEDGRETDALFYFIGGIIEHAQALALFTYSTTNSYRALRRENALISWGRRNDIVEIKHVEKELVVQVNMLDSASSPYLAYSAILCAGLDGLKKKITPPDTSKKSKRKHLPLSLEDAIAAFESDPTFIKSVISTEFLEDYLEQKVKEIEEMKKAVSTEEIRRYIDV
jgi:glutamine synthetase